MGCSHNYTCEKCKITVTASLVDVVGMSSKVMAVKCNDCGDIMGDEGVALYWD